ncbi:hypothetical protein F5Y05DRAFT_358779 [Hypoxylon sp. FL0543]|nr:hypothetical protein F5Y05DRAFT_358779 [Hypoxylon sp. FL0543]
MLAARFVLTARNGAGAVSRGRIISPYKPTVNMNSHISKPPSSFSSLNFSTSIPGLEKKQPAKNSPEELPAFSFEGLGMSRNTKIAVIVILSIFGTIESIFWIKWIWNWFSGTKGDESERKA